MYRASTIGVKMSSAEMNMKGAAADATAKLLSGDLRWSERRKVCATAIALSRFIFS
jgi:hypothetical protein